MLYILHHSEQDILKKNILSLVGKEAYVLLDFPIEAKPDIKEADILVAFLRDEELKEIIPHAAEKGWTLGILPHPEKNLIPLSLGIDTDIKTSIKNILDREKNEKLDLLSCNNKVVFNSVNIGHVFHLTKEEEKNKKFITEIVLFLGNIRKISGLKHKNFKLSIDGKNIIHTSAIGIIIVEHSSTSIISKRLIPKAALNDGQFYAFIISPSSILQLSLFFLRSLMPRKKNIQLPSFIGQIRTSNLRIATATEEEFSIDGEKYSANCLELQVRPEALNLAQTSLFCEEKSSTKASTSLKLDHLPKGQQREELSKYKLPFLPRATPEDFKDLFTLLRKNSVVTSPYLVMMTLSTLIATFGLFGNSSPVIIGAMILAPIISPIVSFSMGMVRYDLNLLRNGILTILAGTIVALFFSALISFIIPIKVLTTEIEARLSPNLLDMGIAVASGIAAAYAHARTGIAKSLAGVAIAVALVPPLSVAGIGLGWWDWQVFSGAFLLYLTNLSGIILFAGLSFLLLGFAPFKTAKRGLVYTFLLTLLVMVPLSLSFNQIMEEARIKRELEGSIFNEIVLKDVQVRFGSKFLISVKLVGPETIGTERMEEIKEQIEQQIGHPIILEVLSAVEF